MNGKDKVFAHIDKSGFGLEIGPSYNPLAPKKEGYNIHIIDHMSRDLLIEKYRDHHVNLENIEEVDFVWSGENFEDLTGKSKFYDYIIASHVIEHTPNLIGFLQNCDSVLKNNGVVSLVVPDKRYCFDYYRPISGISKIIDSHYNNCNIHTPGSVAEYFLNVVSKSGNIAWNHDFSGEYCFVHSLADASNGIKSVTQDMAYLDVHAWCFTPSSFRLIIHDLFSLDFIPFQEVCYFETDGCEFYVTLGRNGQGITESRLKLLENIELELSQPASHNSKLQKPWWKFWR
jgi:predicted SAM-dependent methyltransferase